MVESCLLSVPKLFLQKHILTCFKCMRDCLNAISNKFEAITVIRINTDMEEEKDLLKNIRPVTKTPTKRKLEQDNTAKGQSS